MNASESKTRVSFDHKPTLIDSPAQQPSPMGLLVLPLSQISIRYTVTPRCTNALANQVVQRRNLKRHHVFCVCVCVLSLF